MKVKGQVNVVELKFQFPINFAIVVHVHVSWKDRMMMVFFVTVLLLLLPLLGVRGVELRNDIDRVIADLNVTIATSQVSR